MATRAEVARTDNSKLGRAVLNDRTNQARAKQAANKTRPSVSVAPKATKPVSKKKAATKK